MGGGAKQDRSGLSEVCMYMYTHIYIHVYRLEYKDFAVDVPASCVAHGAHQARSVHKQPLPNSPAYPQPERFCTRKAPAPEGISDISAGGAAKQDRSGLSEVCMFLAKRRKCHHLPTVQSSVETGPRHFCILKHLAAFWSNLKQFEACSVDV